jgi:hypothetical protein
MMTNWQIRIFLTGLFAGVVYFHGLTQTISDRLIFHSSNGLEVKVFKGSISVNNKALYGIDNDEIIYKSKRNKIIENGGSVFLFLEIDGSPNLDRYSVLKVSKDRIDLVANTISSDVRDYDGDSFLEFGGRDLTEVHPSKDSMYYIPSDYYEISNGNIHYNSSLTKKMDIKLNGIYLLDSRGSDGYCCRVIAKPKKKKSPV